MFPILTLFIEIEKVSTKYALEGFMGVNKKTLQLGSLASRAFALIKSQKGISMLAGMLLGVRCGIVRFF